MADINVKAIQLAMAEQDITYTKLSEISGVAKATLCTIVKRGTCSPANAGKIARALNIETAELIS